MIIVAGRIYVHSGAREQFLARSASSILEARRTNGCLDFVVSADPLEVNRVNVYEEWDSPQALSSFRGSGPSDDLFSLIVRAEVNEYVIPAQQS
jgi:quinol monooxygenase YgiN